jgi:hypothetical protein
MSQISCYLEEGVKIRGRRSERSPSKRMFVGYSTVEPGKQTKNRQRKIASSRAHRAPSNYKYVRHNLSARTESQIPTEGAMDLKNKACDALLERYFDAVLRETKVDATANWIHVARPKPRGQTSTSTVHIQASRLPDVIIGFGLGLTSIYGTPSNRGPRPLNPAYDDCSRLPLQLKSTIQTLLVPINTPILTDGVISDSSYVLL